MKSFVRAALSCVFLFGLAAVSPVRAAEGGAPEAASGAAKDLVLRGDARCTRCHDQEDNPQLLAIGKTKHGTRADGRTPTCTSCHGESDAHVKNPGGLSKRPKPDRTFAKNSQTPMEVRSAACLTCHQGGNRIHWDRSAHAENQVACTSCHKIHAQHDAVRDRVTQTEVCFTCHKTQRVMLRWPSRHPIEEGKVVCSDCHNPHGTAGPYLLVRDNVNDTCYTCHMEKRGPFVRTHEPVEEDCTICHNPHGSTNPNLLKIRPPFLCQSCHQGSSHHATVPNENLVGSPVIANAVIMARGCVNCHTNIHGTNNPGDGSGRGFRR